MKLNKLLIALIFLISNTSISLGIEIKIQVEIDDEIITNIDVENEKKYLTFLNPKLKELKKKDFDKIAKDSLIREIIKKKELKKIFDIDKKYKFVDKIEENLLKQKNINDKNEFINFLNYNNLNYKDIRHKLKLEALWNQLVYKKYSNNIEINEEEIRENITNQLKNSKKKYEYNLSEIVFQEKQNENILDTLKKIKDSIKKVGFENTATMFSLSNTSKNGGLIGWINEVQITEKIRNEISKLKINQISNPIKIPNGILLIKINEKKEFGQKIDIEKELKRFIEIEKNRQLNNFSIIFYKRLKQNTVINDY
tara:strand:- start:651 stop:1583 length:933 start_codon:yes stop_codon:yes gene_type:complete